MGYSFISDFICFFLRHSTFKLKCEKRDDDKMAIDGNRLR